MEERIVYVAECDWSTEKQCWIVLLTDERIVESSVELIKGTMYRD
jgi:hypothetical protein